MSCVCPICLSDDYRSLLGYYLCCKRCGWLFTPFEGEFAIETPQESMYTVRAERARELKELLRKDGCPCPKTHLDLLLKIPGSAGEQPGDRGSYNPPT